MDFGWPMIRTYVRYAAGLPGFLRNTITLEDARRLVREGIEAREENFLLLVRRGVYGHPGSPYHWLLRRAGCEYGDLLALVRRHGLEDAHGLGRHFRADAVATEHRDACLHAVRAS